MVWKFFFVVIFDGYLNKWMFYNLSFHTIISQEFTSMKHMFINFLLTYMIQLKLLFSVQLAKVEHKPRTQNVEFPKIKKISGRN